MLRLSGVSIRCKEEEDTKVSAAVELDVLAIDARFARSICACFARYDLS